jgi:4'-phosphopantetheinyl transferase EntD
MSIELNEAALRRHFGAVSKVPVVIVHRNQVAPDFELTAAEKQLQAAFGSEIRRKEHLIGRAALKSALAAIGKSEDTAAITWPSPFCSLSHSHCQAVAVSYERAEGIGIDLQLIKMPALAMAGRILSGDTLAYWQSLPEMQQAKALQRFWTVNEAVYKACRAPQPAYFRHYRMHAAAAMDGTVSIDGTDFRFMVHTAELNEGFISLAYRI